ncbi:MAG: hypothetical protein N2512_01465 [Armatimonadetes bacterium]|nr:hypothetical protein [Armatimonadota bacterium]
MAWACKAGRAAALLFLAALSISGIAAAQQTGAGASSRPRLVSAVADFAESCSYSRRCLGFRAAEWVQALLEPTGRWEMVPRPQVLAASLSLGTAGPVLAVEDLQRLADRLGAHLIVSGGVSKTVLDERARSVKVELRLELTEAVSGELLFAVASGGSAGADRRNPLPTDVLVEEALREASRVAVGKLTARKPVSGSILARTGERELLVGVGSRAGLLPGRAVLARLRNGALHSLGVAEVRKVEADRAVALIVASADPPRLEDLLIVP